ncbi:hypothetical protein MIND_01085900 [Mycena indigotica]|uniref:BTB domain-containing protein n=1 Tax=Mycena indigotica TaxID=2126181 RepID=A0A8H6S9I4_9AGAR|nr:uncharacterized protein MIND_01085900 [Mycena indigotica]KAF7295461.1 hypothetical protein MIND_01085900 [Mycena indigotica]
MSPNNNTIPDSDVKTPTVDQHQDPSQPTKMPRCRSGSSKSQSSPLKPSDPISTASLFTPRAFPPPSLAGVPVEYIIEQLRNYAPELWDKPETADCTLVIPVPHPPGKPLTAFSPTTEPGISRRVTEPALNAVPKISLKLHVDYLCAHSTLLRSLFSGASSLDLISTAALTQAPSQPTPSGQFAVPTNRLPRLMPCSPDHPILFLPIPDPTSIHLLIHWMYFGSTSFIEDSLNDGSVEWEGIARNAEYLGLPVDLKLFLGQWYTKWVHNRGNSYVSEGEEGEEDDDDDDAATVYYSDEEAEVTDKVDLGAALAADDNASDDGAAAPKRGRARIRPISVSSAHSV